MADEYNSKIIAKLYENISDDENERILREMEEIGSPVFIYPIYSAWQKHNSKYSPSSHYFISSLSRIQSGEVLRVGIQIWKEAVSTKDKIWCYEIFTKFNYSDGEIIKYALSLIVDFANSETGRGELYHFSIATVCDYLIKVNSVKDVSESLRKIVISNKFEFDVRKISLQYLWRSNPTPEIKYFIDNYAELKEDDLDIILAKTLITWKGQLITELTRIIKENGNGRAQEILSAEENRGEKEEKKRKRKRRRNTQI